MRHIALYSFICSMLLAGIHAMSKTQDTKMFLVTSIVVIATVLSAACVHLVGPMLKQKVNHRLNGVKPIK